MLSAVACFVPKPNPNINRSERRKEELYAFSEEELRPYFALPEVKKILLTVCRAPIRVWARISADKSLSVLILEYSTK